MNRSIRILALVLAALLLPAGVGVVRALAAVERQYAPLDPPAVVEPADGGRPHDPGRPTAVVVLGANGAEVSDVLAPYEVLATSGAFNVYTVAPGREVLPLTGGLHLAPDLTFAELRDRLGAPPDVVVVPAMPDVGEPDAEPVSAWLREQSAGGSLLVSVCNGAEVLAAAGLLDGRDATSHFARLDALERRYPEVSWRRGTRYVDDGEVISTGGLLSNIDGSLRVVERLAGADVARRTADEIGWDHYSPGAPAALPVQQLGPGAVIFPVNAAYRTTDLGVVLTDGVGELELASVFDTYSGQSLAARTVAVTVADDVVTSRHGLRFVPVADLDRAGGLDRLLVPGADAAGRRDPDLAARADALGLAPEYVHAEAGFPFEATLRDLARTTDRPTARWAAKVLEYPVDGLRLTGPSWPWSVLVLPSLLTLAGLAVVAGVALTVRRRALSHRLRPTDRLTWRLS